MPYSTITAISNGYVGSPGYHKMHFFGSLLPAEASTCAAAMRQFYFAINTLQTSRMTLTWQPTYQTFDDKGVLTGESAIPSVPLPVVGAAASVYAGGVGACVIWTTGFLNGGHKVRGRTYLVPMVSPAFEADGTLAASSISLIGGAATALIGTVPSLAVNSRSRGGAQRQDITAPVNGYLLADKAAILRSRRQ